MGKGGRSWCTGLHVVYLLTHCTHIHVLAGPALIAVIAQTGDPIAPATIDNDIDNRQPDLTVMSFVKFAHGIYR